MPNMEENDLLLKLNQTYKSLSKGQKQLANYIMENYDRAAFITASKMGRIVGVSESTVVRFAYALGYDGYPELQKSLQTLRFTEPSTRRCRSPRGTRPKRQRTCSRKGWRGWLLPGHG